MTGRCFICRVGSWMMLLIVLLVCTSGHGTTAPDPTRGAPLYAVSAANTKPDSITAPQKLPRRPRKTGWGRDPFQYPSVERLQPADDKASNGARLVGIIGGRKGKMAIFGHSIVKKGDVIGNERILDIDENRVTLTRDGSKRIIAMQEAR